MYGTCKKPEEKKRRKQKKIGSKLTECIVYQHRRYATSTTNLSQTSPKRCKRKDELCPFMERSRREQKKIEQTTDKQRAKQKADDRNQSKNLYVYEKSRQLLVSHFSNSTTIHTHIQANMLMLVHLTVHIVL